MTEFCHIPLLSPKPFADYTPEEYQAYVTSLHKLPVPKKSAKKKAVPKDVTVRLNAKGTPVITIKRKPKYVTHAEADALAAELKWTRQALWAHLRKKKIPVNKNP